VRTGDCRSAAACGTGSQSKHHFNDNAACASGQVDIYGGTCQFWPLNANIGACAGIVESR